MRKLHISELDLNLLRVFDAVFVSQSVSRAAELLDMSQPAVSQGLGRLRAVLGDPLFVRSAGGVRPTPNAQRLAEHVRLALGNVERALSEASGFDPAQSSRTFRLHMSDIGENRFLPRLMSALRQRAPLLRVETMPVPRDQIAPALESGRIDFAFGFLPDVQGTRSRELLRDRYVVIVRKGHPFMRQRQDQGGAAGARALRTLELVAVRSHTETLRIVQDLQLGDRLRLVTEHFMVLPSIVKATDLAAIVPLEIAQHVGKGCEVVDVTLPKGRFSVALHWSVRAERDAGSAWFRELVFELFEGVAA
jgi:DNA-binding transcriptional LysR family regulator